MSLLEINYNYVVSIIQISQISLVFVIAIMCFISVKVLQIKQLIWVGSAFSLNLIYIILTIISDDNSPFYTIINFSIPGNSLLPFIFDVLTYFCFYIASISWFYNNINPQNKRGLGKLALSLNHKQLALLVLICITTAVLLLIIKIAPDANNSLINFLLAIYDFLGLLCIIYLFTKTAEKFFLKKFLLLGFWIWAGLQLLPMVQGFIDEKTILIIGFSSSLMAKILILAGIFLWSIDFARASERELEHEVQEKEQFVKSSAFFKDILSKTFHEITIPLKDLDKSLSHLIKNIPRDARLYFEPVENNYERIKAIMTVSQNSYNKDGLQKEDFEDMMPEPVNEMKIVSVNTLIEIAIRSIKNLLSPVQFETAYGGKCFIECNQSEIVQVFTNLFKNAKEAYTEQQEPKIVVKTFVSKDFLDFESHKMVVVEIEDYASGISHDIIEKIWEQGFSTKKIDKNNIVRGQGLCITRELMHKGPGRDIFVESPIKRKNGVLIKGTKFTLLFPKIELTAKKQN